MANVKIRKRSTVSDDKMGDGNLFEDKPQVTKSDLNVKSIPLSQISQLDNSRLTYNEDDMVALMVSLKQTGLLQPIGVTEYEKGKYRVIMGNRRFRAAQKLGWKTIDATVFQTRDYTSEMIANLTENLVRGDVPLGELGRTFHMLTQEGLTLGEIAARVSIPKGRVKQGLDAFNRVPVKFRNKVVHATRKPAPGLISGSVMTEILNMKLSDENTEKLFEASVGEELNAAQLKNVAGYIRRGLSPEDALKASHTLRNVMVQFPMKKTTIEKLIKKYGGSINHILLGFLKEIPELEMKER